MTGPLTSALALATAYFVSRRDPRHKPICYAMLVAWLYATAASSPGSSPEALLVLWCATAAMSGLAYVEAFEAPTASFAVLVGVAALALVAVVCSPAWGAAIWGSFIVSSFVGSIAAFVWLVTSDGQPLSFTKRVALVLLVSDVCMLSFVPFRDVQQWQGRVSALVVTGMQAWWLVRARNRRCT